jgi:uncharacterized repeat protein (TIGR02543 family)
LTTGQVINYKITATDATNNATSTANFTCAPVGTQSILSDDFNQCVLDPETWTVYDPQVGTAGQATIRATGTQLEVTVPGGVNHDVWRDGITAPHIMQEIGNVNFTVEAKFESAVTQKYQIQGLLIKQDDANLVRISFEYVGGGQTYVSVYPITNGEPAIAVSQQIPTKNEPLYLRLERNGTAWEIAYRHESDANFTSGGAYRFTHTLNASEIGFFAGNVGDISVGAAAPAFTAVFDYFFNDIARINPEDSSALYLKSLTAQPSDGGIASSVPVSPTVGAPANCGSPIRLTATAQPGWSFDRWSSAKGSVAGTANPLVTAFDFEEEVTAIFKQDEYTLDRTVVGNGAITVEPLTDTYRYSDVVQLTAVPAPGWSFDSWSGDATGSAPQTALVMTGDAAVTATFTQDEYTLVVNTAGDATGAVTVTPTQQTYHYSDVVTLEAVPTNGALFAGWSGALSGDALNATLTITGNTEVTATFVKNLYVLDVAVVSQHADEETGDGGSVTVTPDKANYIFNEAVNLVAVPNPGWSFSGWSGDATGTTPAITMVMTGNKSVTATFTQNQYTLARTTTGAGQGTIVVSPDQERYVYGDVVTVTATPANGSLFAGWSGALSGSELSQTLTITADTAIGAVFSQREYRINATAVGGQGSEVPGTVTITPAGPYYLGAEVTLTAVANPGYHFVKWTVEPDLSAADATDLTDPTQTLIVGDDVSYFAHFEKDGVVDESTNIFLPLISGK